MDASLKTERWSWSSNAKDIGVLYLIFALFSGLVGTGMSVLIRLELSGPGVQYIADNQLYNSIVTAHAILMIFFMVKEKQINTLSVTRVKNFHSQVKISNENDQKNSLNFKYNYTKVLVEDPYNNRDIIAKVAKKQKGVYIWDKLNTMIY